MEHTPPRTATTRRPWIALAALLVRSAPGAAKALVAAQQQAPFWSPLAMDAIDPDLRAQAEASPAEGLAFFATLDHETGPQDLEALSAAGMLVVRTYPAFHLAFGV